jgi:hypothetical protein
MDLLRQRAAQTPGPNRYNVNTAQILTSSQKPKLYCHERKTTIAEEIVIKKKH